MTSRYNIIKAISDIFPIAQALQARHFSRKQIERLQQRRWQALAKHAYRYSSYYRNLMEKQNIDPRQPNLQCFPVLTKSLFNEHFDQISTNEKVNRHNLLAFLDRSENPIELFLGCYVVFHSSGTSGIQSIQVYSLEEWRRGTLMLLRFLQPSWGRHMAFIGLTGGHYPGVTLASSQHFWGSWSPYRTQVFDIAAPTAETVKALNSIQPSAIHSSASMLRELAIAKCSGVLHISPKVLISSGEALSRENRSLIESCFACPLIDIYGTIETLVLAWGQNSEFLSLLEDWNIFEIQKDHILVTNLLNHTVPLIRYRLDDLVESYLPPDGIDSAFKKIKPVLGRTELDLQLINEYGIKDSISHLTFVEFYVRGLSGLQIKKTSNTSFTFRALLDNQLLDSDKALVSQRIQDKLQHLLAKKAMKNVSFEIIQVKHLERSISGKVKLIL